MNVLLAVAAILVLVLVLLGPLGVAIKALLAVGCVTLATSIVVVFVRDRRVRHGRRRSPDGALGKAWPGRVSGAAHDKGEGK